MIKPASLDIKSLDCVLREKNNLRMHSSDDAGIFQSADKTADIKPDCGKIDNKSALMILGALFIAAGCIGALNMKHSLAE